MLYKIAPFCQDLISSIESQASSFLKYKALFVDVTPDYWAWKISKTIINYTKELPALIVKLISVPRGETAVYNFIEKFWLT